MEKRNELMCVSSKKLPISIINQSMVKDVEIIEGQMKDEEIILDQVKDDKIKFNQMKDDVKPYPKDKVRDNSVNNNSSNNKDVNNCKKRVKSILTNIAGLSIVAAISFTGAIVGSAAYYSHKMDVLTGSNVNVSVEENEVIDDNINSQSSTVDSSVNSNVLQKPVVLPTINSIVQNNKEQDVCRFDEPVYSNCNYDTKICDGQELVNALQNNGIKYCEILDEYYTSDGRDIAELTCEVMCYEEIDVTKVENKINDANIVYYTVPEGYILKGDKAVKEVRKIVTLVIDVEIYEQNPDMIVIYPYTIPENMSLIRKIDIKQIKTKTFDEIISSDFICDVPDNYMESLNNGYSEAEYRLIKKTK